VLVRLEEHVQRLARQRAARGLERPRTSVGWCA
jgi:hypothetical protein